MSYIELGTRKAVGAPDTTGNNKGNWTVVFNMQDLVTNVSYYEVYHAVISGAPNSTMTWFVDNKQWETTAAGDINSWDPVQPLLLIPGQTMYFYWSDPTTDNKPPTVTLWLRYDPQVQPSSVNIGAL
jgi:hypothetical protein